MKRFAASALAVLMLLTIFASTAVAADNTTFASAAVAADNTTLSSLEIRGPVYNGTTLTDILANPAYGNGSNITMDANKFAAFFYDINNNVTTETLSINNVTDTSDRTIGVHGLVYSTTIGKTAYKYNESNWGNYSVLGFFAQKYVPLKPTDASKLARLVLDSKDKYTLRTGDRLDLGQGYSLTARQVDINGSKVWLEFDKDGQYVDDQIVSTGSASNASTWTCQLDNIQGEDNVPVLKVHVSQVFQGAVDSIAQIEGLWLIDYANAIKISSSDEFGKLNNVAINGPTISINNKDTFTLTSNSDQEIGQGLYFRTADADQLRFYVFKKVTDPGVYAIRGTVATGPLTWTADNFAGFFYDLDKNVMTENLSASAVNGRTIPEKNLTYNTTIQSVGYRFKDNTTGTTWTTYPVLGFFAQKYVPLKPADASKLARLVLDSKDKYTLRTGDRLDLGQGYSLTARQVDVDGKKVWLEFDKDGQYVDDQIVSTGSASNASTWTCQLDNIQGEDNVPVLKVHVSQVFQGAVDSIAQIEGLWLIDYANAKKISSSDEFGKLNNVAISGPTISINNKDTFTLTRNSDQEIGQGLFFRTADADQLRYYPFVEQTLGNETNVSTSAPSTTLANNNTSVTPTQTQMENNKSVTTPVTGNNTSAETTPTAVTASETTTSANNSTTAT